MKTFPLSNFVCPVDGLLLIKEAKTLRCAKGHSFDAAREGYFNLLLVQQKASLDPGDNKEMVAARRRFLDGGYFAPVAERLFELVSGIIKEHGNEKIFRIVDAGCGEGYYLHQLSKFASVSKQPIKSELAGFDISKWAVKSAAKRSKEISWVVAGNRQIPFAEGSVDIILSMFGFPDWKSFKKALIEGGRIILVDPGSEHLIELKKNIYPEVDVSSSPELPTAAVEAGFILEKEEPLKFSVSLRSNPAIQDLLAMTPHAYRVTPKARENLRALKGLSVTVDVVLRVLKLFSKRSKN